MTNPPFTAGLAPGIVLAPGYTLRVTALDPTDGSTVTDVVISDVSLQVDADTSDTDTGAGRAVVPLFVYAEPT